MLARSPAASTSLMAKIWALVSNFTCNGSQAWLPLLSQQKFFFHLLAGLENEAQQFKKINTVQKDMTNKKS